MKNKVADILGSATLPAMICVASGDEGSNETEFNVSLFSDATADKAFSVMSNVEKPFSPATGEYIVAGEQKPVETASMNRLETLAGLVCVASCVGCKHDTYVAAEVAEQLDGNSFYCTSCGEKVEAFYDGDFEPETASEDDEDFSEDDVEEDIVDAVEEDEEETNEDDETSEEETEEEVTDEEPTEDDVEVEEDVEDIENLEEEASATETETPADKNQEEAATEENQDKPELSDRKIEVEVASVANFEDSLQFASLSDTSRLEVFLGNTHIGSLLKDESSESVQKYFNNVPVLRSAFGSQFWKNAQEIASGDTKSINDFGFQPARITVAVDKVVASEIANAEAEVQAKKEADTAELTESIITTIHTAMASLDKGLVKGPSLVRELAKELASYNVQHPVEAAKRFATRFSVPYFRAVVEQASELRTKSADYVRGYTETVEKASYNVDEAIQDSAALITSAMTPVVTPKPDVRGAVVEKASIEKPASAGNKFKGVFDTMNRRR